MFPSQFGQESQEHIAITDEETDGSWVYYIWFHVKIVRDLTRDKSPAETFLIIVSTFPQLTHLRTKFMYIEEGCRFGQKSFFYRPYNRQKPLHLITHSISNLRGRCMLFDLLIEVHPKRWMRKNEMLHW